MTDTARPDPDHFRHLERLRVRWAEVDAQNIVFNGHYLMYLDTAVAGYWRALALPYEQTMAQLGGELFVRKSTLEYLASARYDEQLEVGIRMARLGRSSMTFDAAVFRQGRLLLTGELVYVFADPQAGKSRPLPSELRAALSAFESGEAMLDLRLGAWPLLADAARAVRTEVFLEEQGIPLEMEWDEDDASALHAVAFNRLGLPLATGRLLQHAPQVARIGRMASIKALRGGGVGRQVLAALMQAARARGDREVLLHAQTRAAAFYARAGFVPRGEVFQEAGIPHVEMARTL